MPKKRTEVEKIREIFRLCLELNFSIRKAAEAIEVSKTTVGEYLAEFKRSGLSYQDFTRMSDTEIFDLFEKSNKSSNPLYDDLSKDFTNYQMELKRPGVTLYLLWEEYKERNKEGFSYSRFCHHYRMWESKLQPDLHRNHKAGERMYADYTGKKMPVMNRNTGAIREADIFVGILGASQLTYVEASWGQTLEEWVRVNENSWRYYGGATKAVSPDNLKAAVTHACNYEPLINETYHALARHYHTVILPTRPGKPKDKPLVENAVRLVYQRIFARLRNTTFFSLEELNQAIWQELERHNNMPFQKRDISRRQLFEEIEKHELQPLPAQRFELTYYQMARVEFNYHVYLKEDKHYYSVPYTYIGKRLKILYTERTVEIYKDNLRIAFHQRNLKKYDYTTVDEHMPPNHKYVNGWSPDRFIKWADKMGAWVKEFIRLMLDQRAHPEQAFKACMGVLKLGKSYDQQAMQIVCKRAIELNTISYRFIANSLKNKTYELEQEEPGDLKLPFHENIRGKENYQ